MRKPLHQVNENDIQASEEGRKWLDLVREFTLDIREISVTFNPVSIIAATTVEQTVEAKGLKVQDIILSVVKPTLTTGIGVLQARVSAADTLAIQLINATAGAIDPPSEVYTVIYIKNSRI